jgi:hypothetical protein
MEGIVLVMLGVYPRARSAEAALSALLPEVQPQSPLPIGGVILPVIIASRPLIRRHRQRVLDQLEESAPK